MLPDRLDCGVLLDLLEDMLPLPVLTVLERCFVFFRKKDGMMAAYGYDEEAR